MMSKSGHRKWSITQYGEKGVDCRGSNLKITKYKVTDQLKTFGDFFQVYSPT